MPDIWMKRLVNQRFFNKRKKKGAGLETRRGGTALWWSSPDYGIPHRVLTCKDNNRCGLKCSTENR